MRGAYLLFLNVKRNIRIRVGGLGLINLRSGYYVYVGSALASLEKRIERHFRKTKKLRWHIDYLTSDRNVNVEFAIAISSDSRIECSLSEEIARYAVPVAGFGKGDCSRCSSHLYRIRS